MSDDYRYRCEDCGQFWELCTCNVPVELDPECNIEDCFGEGENDY